MVHGFEHQIVFILFYFIFNFFWFVGLDLTVLL